MEVNETLDPKPKKRNLFTQQQLDYAKEKLEKGFSKRKIAELLGVPESTLRYNLEKDKPPENLGRYKKTFNPEMSKKLANHIRKFDSMFYGLTKWQTRKLAFDFAEANELDHQFNKNEKLAGEKWLANFCKENKLSVRAPEGCSAARASGFNKVQVSKFFDNLKNLYEEYAFLPERIFNMDESGISTVVNKLPKVISPTGKRTVSKIISAERGQTITVVCCMSASGIYVPPAMIFPRMRMKDELFKDAPTGTLRMISESGFINRDLFLEWLAHFKEKVQPSKQNPVLLILDNHNSHCTLPAINYCRENSIVLLGLPPHCSHQLQPLDRTFFFPLKRAYAKEVDKFLLNNPGRVVVQTDVAKLFRDAYVKVCTIDKAEDGFRCTGIKPFNPDVFTDEDFAPASVTDQPLEIAADGTNDIATIPTTPTNHLQSAVERPPLSGDDKNEEPVPLETATDGVTTNTNDFQSAVGTSVVGKPVFGTPVFGSSQLSIDDKKEADEPVPLETATDDVTANTNDFQSGVGTSGVGKPVFGSPRLSIDDKNDDVISPGKILPLPKGKPRQRKRKGIKSEIMTSSPFKKQKEELENKKPQKLENKKPQKSKSGKKKASVTEPQKPESSKCRKSQRTRTQLFKPLDNNDDPDDPTVSSNDDDDENPPCVVCNEPYIFSKCKEKWIQCTSKSCLKWSHIKCTVSQKYVKNFICDICTD